MNSSDINDNSFRLKFSWHDHLIFILMLCISVVIGIYHGYISHKVKSVTSYLLGDKSMGILPVAGSLIARYALRINNKNFIDKTTQVLFQILFKIRHWQAK